jgi:hypothetical protein
LIPSRRQILGILAASALPLRLPAQESAVQRPDHFQLGIPDLDQGIDIVKNLTGIDPARGGAHPGYGTRNALASLGAGSYLEILALDPAQSDLKTPRTERIHGLAGPTILTFALQTTAIDAKLAQMSAIPGLAGKLDRRSRKTADGSTLDFTTLVIDSAFGPQLPFFIDWRNTPHPSTTAPAGCQLLEFVTLHPDAEALRDIYRRLDITIPVEAAAKPGFIAKVRSPKGNVTFLG